MKRTIAFLLCFAIPALSSQTAVRSTEPSRHLSENAKPSLLKSDTSQHLRSQTKRIVIQLPRTRGAWLVEMSRDGGMRPSKSSVSVNFAGDITATSEHFAGGKTVIDCSLKERVPTKALRALREAIAAGRVSIWKDRYEDPEHPICCDQPTTNLTLQWRGTDGLTKTFNTSWYPGSFKLVPADLVKIVELIQPLWNKVGEDCERND